MNCQIVGVMMCWLLILTKSDPTEQTLENPYPYEFPNLKDEAIVGRTLFPMPLCHGFKLEEATIDQMQERMSNGTLTSEKIALCYLQRVYQTDEYLK